MRTRLPVLTGVTLLTALTLAGCSAEDPEPDVPRVTQPTSTTPDPTPPDGSTQSPDTGGQAGAPRVQGTVVEGLAVPWGIDFLPSGDAIVTERDSRRVLRITPGGDVTELGVVESAVSQGEAGLLGVAVSPDFDRDHELFLYVTTADDNRVLRAELDGDRLGEPDVVLDGIPQGFTHDGGRLDFGPDGHLYVTTGETGAPDLSQNLDSLGGKILRITPDGAPAPGNPNPQSPIWTSGHRNVQGIAWDARERLWASEFGAQTRDELNLIVKGEDYGWPQFEGAGGAPEFADPHLVWPVAEASPSGLVHLDGHLYMAGLRGERLWRVDVTGEKARDPKAFLAGEHGRLRTVVAAPDGSLWVATSNQDGRGDPQPGDDRILRVTIG